MDLTEASRAAKVTHLLMQRPLTTTELQEALGYKQRQGVYFLMRNLMPVLPLYQPERGLWAMRGEGDEVSMTPQARAATAVVALNEREQMSSQEIQELLGYESRQAVIKLMDNLSAGGVPVYQPNDGYWAIMKD